MSRHHLVSYPKCGRTWLRLLIGKTLQFEYPKLSGLPDEDLFDLVTLSKKYKVIPSLEASHDGKPWEKSRLVFNRDKYRGTSVLFLIRDPRDVMVSFYQHCTHRVKKDHPLHFDGDLTSFITREIGGLNSLLNFYVLWAANMTSEPGRYKAVRYENLQAACPSVLMSVMYYLGVRASKHNVKKAVDYCSFANMKRLERAGTVKSKRLQPLRKGDPESYKVRKGKVGGYKDYMTRDDQIYCRTMMSCRLNEWSYFRSYMYN